MTEGFGGTASVLFVCTANRCRSPLMEAMAGRLLTGKGVVVASAGLLPGGEPMPPRGVAVAAERGLSLQAHRSKRIQSNTVDTFDLVLTASREHARHLVSEWPELWPRVFTLKQFVRWVEGRTWDRSLTLRDWISDEAIDRARVSIVGDSAVDDVRDPVASSRRVWRAVADEIDDSLRRGLVPLFV